MMFYYETKDNSGRRAGVIAAALYVCFWAALMFLVSFSFSENDVGEGILINFGDTEEASGLYDPMNAEIAVNKSVPSSNAVEGEEEILTQDFEDAPEVEQRTEQNTAREQQRNNNENTPQESTPPSRQVDQRALFPGMTQGSTSTSEGTGQGAGNQGAPEGSPAGSHDGTGTGGGGTGFDLAGRSVVGSLPVPSYGANKSGRVVVEITVDSGGRVVNATYRARGSTTNDSDLVNSALRAARQSRFNVIDSDNMQTGTITYNFQLR